MHKRFLFGSAQTVGHSTKTGQGQCRKCGTPASEPIKVTLDVFEEPRYDVLSHEDISDGTAKRYKATILTDPHYTKETIKEVIKTATMELRQSTFYGNSMARNRFGQQEAGCVFLFVYVDRRDIQPCNWICRTSWIHPDVPEIFWPPTSGDEWLGEIQIDWRADYHEMRTFWLSQYVKKEVWTQQVERVLPSVEKMVQVVLKLLAQFKQNATGKEALHQALTRMETKARKLYQNAGEQGWPPPECQDCETIFQCMMGSFHNIFLPFMARGQANWDWEQKLRIMKDGLQRYTEEHKEFLYEWKKIGKR